MHLPTMWHKLGPSKISARRAAHYQNCMLSCGSTEKCSGVQERVEASQHPPCTPPSPDALVLPPKWLVFLLSPPPLPLCPLKINRTLIHSKGGAHTFLKRLLPWNCAVLGHPKQRRELSLDCNSPCGSGPACWCAATSSHLAYYRWFHCSVKCSEMQGLQGPAARRCNSI